MFCLGYLFGVITSGALLFGGYWLSLWRYVPPSNQPPRIPRPSFFPAKKGKHTPKYFSEEKIADIEKGGPGAELERLRQEHYGGP